MQKAKDKPQRYIAMVLIGTAGNSQCKRSRCNESSFPHEPSIYGEAPDSNAYTATQGFGLQPSPGYIFAVRVLLFNVI